MSAQNPLWGAPRIHGELLKLGFEISQSTVSKYMPRRPADPDQTWKTFLRNHMDCTASIDFLVVPTLSFKLLFVLVVLSHDRRYLIHFAVTTNPTAEWTAQMITEAFPWYDAPRFFIRDRDRTYGQAFRDRVAAMDIMEIPRCSPAARRRKRRTVSYTGAKNSCNRSTAAKVDVAIVGSGHADGGEAGNYSC